MVKLVYTYALGAYASRRAGSSPVSGTKESQMAYLSHFLWNNRVEWTQVVHSNFLKLPSAKISLASILVKDSSNSAFF